MSCISAKTCNICSIFQILARHQQQLSRNSRKQRLTIVLFRESLNTNKNTCIRLSLEKFYLEKKKQSQNKKTPNLQQFCSILFDQLHSIFQATHLRAGAITETWTNRQQNNLVTLGQVAFLCTRCATTYASFDTGPAVQTLIKRLFCHADSRNALGATTFFDCLFNFRRHQIVGIGMCTTTQKFLAVKPITERWPFPRVLLKSGGTKIKKRLEQGEEITLERVAINPMSIGIKSRGSMPK